MHPTTPDDLAPALTSKQRRVAESQARMRATLDEILGRPLRVALFGSGSISMRVAAAHLASTAALVEHYRTAEIYIEKRGARRPAHATPARVAELRTKALVEARAARHAVIALAEHLASDEP